jgi:hypothetical protein
MKGMVSDFSEMRIESKPCARMINKILHRMDLDYKERWNKK